MGSSAIRMPAVAGYFYPDDPPELDETVRRLLEPEGDAGRSGARMVMVPHAGYIYSGRIAGLTYARVRPVDRVVVLAVNHRGTGRELAAWEAGSWRTPLGSLEVDVELVAAIGQHCPALRHDAAAHLREHSLEVQLPFLQRWDGAPPRIAPILIATHDPGSLAQLGHAVAEAIAASPEPVLIVASSDMNHYEDARTSRRKDELALREVLALDPAGLLSCVRVNQVSMCGVAPTAAGLFAARELGALHAELVCYGNSGDVTGDQESVVGYAGVIVR